jgi:arylformamidase
MTARFERVIDISVPNGPGQHVYPGDPEPRVESVHRIVDGKAANVSLLVLGSHTGTHVDAPYHFIDDGRPHAVAPRPHGGEAVVLDLRGRPATPRSPGRSLRAGDIVLFRTDNPRWASPSFADFAYVRGCARLVARRAGDRHDYLSIEQLGARRFRAPHPAGAGLRDRGPICAGGTRALVPSVCRRFPGWARRRVPCCSPDAGSWTRARPRRGRRPDRCLRHRGGAAAVERPRWRHTRAAA